MPAAKQRREKMEKKLAEIWKNRDGYIVLDNGGGLTLVIPTIYQHTYDNATQCAQDLIAYLQEDTPTSETINWDGNELCICCDADWAGDECPECGGYRELDPSIEDINNGGYRVIRDADDLRDPWGCNGRDLADALEGEKKNA